MAPPCIAGVSLRTGAAIVGVLQLLGAAITGISFTVLVADSNTELLVLTGVTAVCSLILGTGLSCGVLMDRKDLCKLWVWISTLQAILSLIVIVLLMIASFWLGFILAIFLIIHVWLIVVVYEFTNEIEGSTELNGQTDLSSTQTKIITDV